VIGGIPKTFSCNIGKILGTREKKYYIAVTELDVLADMRMVIFETIKYTDRVCCNAGYLRNTQNNTTDKHCYI
jgi:hypothetical protein